jgi:4-amino-4-deoxy-L-arabinose transferase-like glycosyltransferase
MTAGATLGPRRIVILAVLALLILLPGRISLPPLDRDESRYLEASRQMLTTGDLIDIRFQDQPRWLQPAGIYWLEAGTVRLVDALAGSKEPEQQAWPYRIVSLVAGTINVVLTASIGASLFGAEAGFLAGVILAVSVLFNAEGRMATIDTTLLTTTLIALRCVAVERGWALYWIALGCGLMLKGPVGLIPVLGTPIALSLVERDPGVWRRLRPALGLPLALAIVLPWCLAIQHVSHGRFFATAVGHNLLGKVSGAQESHGAPFGTYAAIFLAAFWPGSLFAALAIPFAWANRRTRPVRLLLCWILPTWLVFELIATKLPHYVLPAYPAIACLTAAALLAPVVRTGRAARVLAWIYAALWLAAGLAFAASGPVLLAVYQHEGNPLGTIAGLTGAACLIGAAVLLLRDRRPRAFALSAIGACAIYAGLFIGVIPNLTTLWLSPRIAAAVRTYRPCPDSVLASSSFSEPSLIFLTGRSTRLVGPVDAARLLNQDRACGMALVGARDTAAFEAALSVPVSKRTEIDGVNYSNGHHLALSLYVAAPVR